MVGSHIAAFRSVLEAVRGTGEASSTLVLSFTRSKEFLPHVECSHLVCEQKKNSQEKIEARIYEKNDTVLLYPDRPVK